MLAHSTATQKYRRPAGRSAPAERCPAPRLRYLQRYFKRDVQRWFRGGLLRRYLLARCAVCLTLTALLSCASFEPGTVADAGFQERLHSKTNGQLRISVVALSDAEARAFFDVSLSDDGIQPVYFEVENESEQPFWLLFSGLDPNYYSPTEAAYHNRHRLSDADRARMVEFFIANHFRNPVAPGAVNKGFVFLSKDDGLKLMDIDLAGFGRAEHFSFLLGIPGLHTDFSRVDLEALYRRDELHAVDEGQLHLALEQLPCCTTNAEGSEQGDPLNVVFVGSYDEVFSALIKRDWRPTEYTYLGSAFKTVDSFFLGKKYLYSPVSPLYVFGRRQDFAVQKVRESINMRNHMRLWLTPMTYQGEHVWIGQISRDIGVKTTLKSPFLLTHRVDSYVDEAREFLVHDMYYSHLLKRVGFSKGVGEASRANPRQNLSGDSYFTDGLRAVLQFDRKPSDFGEVRFFEWELTPRVQDQLEHEAEEP